jgi:hypothetical protein
MPVIKVILALSVSGPAGSGSVSEYDADKDLMAQQSASCQGWLHEMPCMSCSLTGFSGPVKSQQTVLGGLAYRYSICTSSSSGLVAASC